MERTGYEQIQSDDLDLPGGYTVETREVWEEETGKACRALLLTRADGSAAGLFACSASGPTVEEVNRISWDDYHAIGERVR